MILHVFEANSVPLVQLLCNTQSSKEARFMLLHFSIKCFRSLIPVVIQSLSDPGFWNNRQGKQKNALLTEQPANQLRLAYRLEEKLRVYVLPRSMLCCYIFKSGRSGPMSFSLFLSTSDRHFESFQSAYSQNQSLC